MGSGEWRLRGSVRADSKRNDGFLVEGSRIRKRGCPSSGRLIFRAINARVLVLSAVGATGAIRAICYRFRTMVAKLTYATNDGAIFSTPVISRTVYVSLPPKTAVKYPCLRNPCPSARSSYL